jgi:hypothetical protein
MAISEDEYVWRQLKRPDNLEYLYSRFSKDELGRVRHVLPEAMTYVFRNRSVRKSGESLSQYIQRLNDLTIRTFDQFLKDVRKKNSPEPPKTFAPLEEKRDEVSSTKSESLSLAELSTQRAQQIHDLFPPVAPNEMSTVSASAPEPSVPKPSTHTEEYKAPALQHHFVMIDSTHRNVQEFPDPSNYRIPFSTPFKEVAELELIQASVPNSVYTITSTNQTILFREETDTLLGSAPIKTATVPIGMYSSAQLLAAVEQAMNDAGSRLYQVTQEPATQHVILAIRTPGPSQVFSVDPASTLLGLLGFSGALTGSTSYRSTKALANTPHPYVLLHLDNIPSRMIGSHTSSQGALLPIFLNVPYFERKVFSSTHEFQHVVHFVPPLESLTFLSISWKTWDNHAVSFGSQNHQLLFRISTWTGTVRSIPRTHHLEVE